MTVKPKTVESKEVTLFLIEDDDVDATNIERSFIKKKINNQLVRACDGIEALEMLRSGAVPSPYIILLDLRMPRMDGLEFLKHLRADEALSKTVVFVLTTSMDEEDIAASYKEHIAGYFVKDETGDRFLNIVDLLDGYWKVVHLPISNEN